MEETETKNGSFKDQEATNSADTELAGGANSEIESCRTELEVAKSQYLRIRADFDNLSRRIEKERTQFVAVGQQAVLSDLLAIVDDFDRALQDQTAKQLQEQSETAEPNKQEQKTWLAGFSLIRSSLYKMLEKYGVKPMASAHYESFDPHLHEAIMQIQSDEHEAGQIVQVLQQGFMIGDQVLRPAKVGVAR